MPSPPVWPAPADPAAAARLQERYAAQGPLDHAFAHGPGAPMLAAIGGGSPFLSDLAIRERATTRAVLEQGPAAIVDAAFTALATTPFDAPRATVAAALRRTRRQVALTTAIADIGSLWTLAQVTATLSRMAEDTVALAIRHLLHAAHRQGTLVLAHPSRPDDASGLIVLGMGKLGARELNYSSDIDLILLYDPDLHAPSDTLGATFTRLARDLVAMMETRDADGYVFRTDLRLRPDPAATPPCVALPAAIAYYESMGQNWERAAMTKARPIAGDIAAGHAFLAAIHPFIWRRRLDFEAIADLHAMKRRIDAHRGFSPHTMSAPVLPGLDVKLAPGGIREVEFAAQTLQLVWGGRDPTLRDPTTLGALRRLARAGHLPRRAAAELTVAYRLFRRVEHRLQMVDDRQTHALPTNEAALARFAPFLGCPTPAALATLLGTHMARVRARYAAVFEAVPDEAGAPRLDLAGPDLPLETAARLQALGFRNIEGMGATLRGWRAGRLRALRSARARELLDATLPRLLAALAAQADPDAAFARLDTMLARLPAGVPLLSMLQRNPALAPRIAAVLGAAPSLADHLASTAAALEGLLSPPEATCIPPAQILAARLADARTLEDTIAITRDLVRAEEFRLCVQQMEGTLDADEAGIHRTALADAALGALLTAVLADHARRHGTIRGGDMAVVALGKAGSGEMMAGSDLDLLLLYHVPPNAPDSTGPRRLPPSQWFIRAAHAFVAALTSPGGSQGAAGPLYEVDMRLRPSGNKGPVAVPLAGFARYQAAEAWTWERMALTRARVVAGRPAIRARAAAAIAEALLAPHDPARTRADAADMRRRLLRDRPAAGPWDMKHRDGGGMEVEFIAQVLQLTERPTPIRQNTADALAHLAATGALEAAEAATLIEADRLWRTVQSLLRITVGRAPAGLPAPAEAALLHAAARIVGRPLDRPALDATLDRAAHAVRASFNHRIGPVP